MSAVNDWNKLWTLYDSDPTTFQQDIKPLVLLGCDNLLLRLAREKPAGFWRIIAPQVDKLTPLIPINAWQWLTKLLAVAIPNGKDLTETEITSCLEQSIRESTERQWGNGTTPRLLTPAGTHGTMPEPVWVRSLNNEWQSQFRNLAETVADGWLDPALNLVGGIVAWVLGAGDEPWCHTNPDVTTWVLFAGPGSAHVGCLSLWRLEKGGGLFYPHPLAGSWLSTDDLFQVALQNSWYRAIRPHLGWYAAGPVGNGVDFDVCWSIDFEHDRKLNARPALTGRSGEVAMARALCALHEGNHLDPQIVIACCFEKWDTLCADDALCTVDLLKEKLQAPEFGARAKSASILDIVLCNKQRSTDAELKKTHPDLTVHRVQQFQDTSIAYKSEQMVRAANQGLARSARARLNAHCLGDYLPTHLSKERPRDQFLPDPEPLYDPLGDVENAFLMGRAPDHPLFTYIAADSGGGKTSLLDFMSVCIADNLVMPLQVPILLDPKSLSHLPQRDKFLPERIVPHLRAALRDTKGHDPYSDKELEWLADRLRRARRLVFLVDAVDQISDTTRSQLVEWLKSDGGGFATCPVFVTGRGSTKSSFTLAGPSGEKPLHVRVEPFDDQQLRAFFGQDTLARLEDLFPEREGDRGVSPLRVPMVAALIRQAFAQPGLLKRLKWINRERIYWVAVDGPAKLSLVQKGRETADENDANSLPRTNVVQLLGVMAWTLLYERCNFSSYAEDEDYDKVVEAAWNYATTRNWHTQYKISSGEELIKRLIRINLVTRVIETGNNRLDWRHLSLCEYVAGIHLAERLTENEQVDAIGEILDMLTAVGAARKEYDEKTSQGESIQHPVGISPRDRWRWPLRFALCRAFANQTENKEVVNQHALKTLACAIMGCGDPYVVYRAITEDHVQLPDELDGLARWLVHQTWTLERDYTPNDAEDWPDLPAASATVLDAVTKLFDPKYRNGPVLPPAWRIVEQLGTESDAAQAVREKLLPQDSSDVLKMLNSFKPCPPPDFPQTKYGDHFRPGDKANEWIFKMGAGEDDKEAFFDERPQIEVAIRAFDMAEFPVTNAELEWLDPSHYWLRNQYSRLDDQPALHVNYWTATFYAGWVDQIVRRSKPDAPAANLVIRLPTECEYEFAARGGSPDVYPWGPELENDKCNASSVTLARHESSDRYRNGFKLLHAVGNHFVWCADAYVEDILKKMQSSQPVKAWITRPQPASSVSARGGGLYFNPGDYRVSFRVVIQPTDLRYVTGFRLCRGEAFPASS